MLFGVMQLGTVLLLVMAMETLLPLMVAGIKELVLLIVYQVLVVDVILLQFNFSSSNLAVLISYIWESKH